VVPFASPVFVYVVEVGLAITVYGPPLTVARFTR
jgi:hypothetical protein